MEIEILHHLFSESTGVSTDTRSIDKGNIFFALKGPNFNGNIYAAHALENGASFAVVDEPVEFEDESRIIQVENVLRTLQELSNYHRKQFDGPVIGLTGSNGKTTTKELIHAVLSIKYNVVATKGNLNNHIGVPLTLLTITEETEIAIIEMGANHVGEIAELCRMAEPSHGLITNIGKAHIGTFGGFENIIRGKSELFDFLIKTDGVIWVNTRDDVLKNMTKRMRAPRLYPEGELISTILESSDPFVSYSDKDGSVTKTQLIGEYNFLNIAAAKAVGHEFNVRDYQANRAIKNYLPSNNRSQVILHAGKTIVLDAYNANPSSMEVAIDNFINMSGTEKLMILGDMYELGADEESEHINLGQKAASSNIETWFVGELTKQSADQGDNLHWFRNKLEIKTNIDNKISRYDTILIKGSRGIKLEELLDWF